MIEEDARCKTKTKTEVGNLEPFSRQPVTCWVVNDLDAHEGNFSEPAIPTSFNCISFKFSIFKFVSLHHLKLPHLLVACFFSAPLEPQRPVCSPEVFKATSVRAVGSRQDFITLPERVHQIPQLVLMPLQERLASQGTVHLA